MKKMVLLIAAICFAALCIDGLAASNASMASKAPSNNSTLAKVTSTANLLVSDSGTNLSIMNATFTSPGVFGIAQTVKFTPPKPDWKLEEIVLVGTDGWNSSNPAYPVQYIFGLEVRDKDLKLLYQYADTQLEYFTSPTGFRTAKIEVPALPMTGDFYICFYGRDGVKTLTELQDATGNSYYYLRDTGQLLKGGVQLKDNTTLPVNWIIRAIGE